MTTQDVPVMGAHRGRLRMWHTADAVCVTEQEDSEHRAWYALLTPQDARRLAVGLIEQAAAADRDAEMEAIGESV
jgi:hypothetical protein